RSRRSGRSTLDRPIGNPALRGTPQPTPLPMAATLPASALERRCDKQRNDRGSDLLGGCSPRPVALAGEARLAWVCLLGRLRAAAQVRVPAGDGPPPVA